MMTFRVLHRVILRASRCVTDQPQDMLNLPLGNVSPTVSINLESIAAVNPVRVRPSSNVVFGSNLHIDRLTTIQLPVIVAANDIRKRQIEGWRVLRAVGFDVVVLRNIRLNGSTTI